MARETAAVPICEITERRTETGRTYLLSDGRLLLTATTTPLGVDDGRGGWRNFAAETDPVSREARIEGPNFLTTFGDDLQAGPALTIETDGTRITLSPRALSGDDWTQYPMGTRTQQYGTCARWQGAYGPGTSFHLSHRRWRIEKGLTLDFPCSDTGYDWVLEVGGDDPAGLLVAAEEDRITVADWGRIVATFGLPTVEDDCGNVIEVDYEIVDGRFIWIKVRPDDLKGMVYPITIDPNYLSPTASITTEAYQKIITNGANTWQATPFDPVSGGTFLNPAPQYGRAGKANYLVGSDQYQYLWRSFVTVDASSIGSGAIVFSVQATAYVGAGDGGMLRFYPVSNTTTAWGAADGVTPAFAISGLGTQTITLGNATLSLTAPTRYEVLAGDETESALLTAAVQGVQAWRDLSSLSFNIVYQPFTSSGSTDVNTTNPPSIPSIFSPRSGDSVAPSATFGANYTSPDNQPGNVTFQVRQQSGGTASYDLSGAQTPSGNVSTVDAVALPAGGYTVQALATDSRGLVSSLSAATTFTVRTAPGFPTDLYPNFNAQVQTLTPTFSATYHTTSGGALVFREIEIYSLAGSLAWSSGPQVTTGLVDGNVYNTALPGGAIQSGLQYSWRIRFTDQFGLQSPWSLPATFMTGQNQNGPSLVVVGGNVVFNKLLTVLASINDSARNITKVQLQLLDAVNSTTPGSTVMQDESTNVLATVQTAGILFDLKNAVPATTAGAQYFLRAKIWDQYNVESPWSSPFLLQMNDQPQVFPLSPGGGVYYTAGARYRESDTDASVRFLFSYVDQWQGALDRQIHCRVRRSDNQLIIYDYNRIWTDGSPSFDVDHARINNLVGTGWEDWPQSLTTTTLLEWSVQVFDGYLWSDWTPWSSFNWWAPVSVFGGADQVIFPRLGLSNNAIVNPTGVTINGSTDNFTSLWGDAGIAQTSGVTTAYTWQDVKFVVERLNVTPNQGTLINQGNVPAFHLTTSETINNASYRPPSGTFPNNPSIQALGIYLEGTNSQGWVVRSNPQTYYIDWPDDANVGGLIVKANDKRHRIEIEWDGTGSFDNFVAYHILRHPVQALPVDPDPEWPQVTRFDTRTWTRIGVVSDPQTDHYDDYYVASNQIYEYTVVQITREPGWTTTRISPIVSTGQAKLTHLGYSIILSTVDPFYRLKAERNPKMSVSEQLDFKDYTPLGRSKPLRLYGSQGTKQRTFSFQVYEAERPAIIDMLRWLKKKRHLLYIADSRGEEMYCFLDSIQEDYVAMNGLQQIAIKLTEQNSPFKAERGIGTIQ